MPPNILDAATRNAANVKTKWAPAKQRKRRVIKNEKKKWKEIYNKKEKKGKREKKEKKKEKSVNGSTVFCLFCVTIDDTSVIYMWGHIDVQADSVKNCRVRLHLFHEIPHRLKKMKKKKKV